MAKKLDATEITLNAIIAGIQNIKGKEIAIIDLKTINHSECSYYIICNGTSGRHAVAVANSVEDTVKELTGDAALHKEGFQNNLWILLDYGDILVHIFQKEAREFYSLESLWADAKITKIEEES